MRGEDGVITPIISVSLAGTSVRAVVVVARAGIGPAMVGINRGVRPATSDRNDVLVLDASDASTSERSGVCECDPNLGVRPATSDRNDARELDVCGASASELDRSGVNTTVVLIAGEGTFDCSLSVVF